MSWNYAELSKSAKEAGGPEILIKEIEGRGEKKGMIKIVIFLIGFELAKKLPSAIENGKKYSKKAINLVKKKISESKRLDEAAKLEIIQGINDYDASHSNTEEESACEKNVDEESLKD